MMGLEWGDGRERFVRVKAGKKCWRKQKKFYFRIIKGVYFINIIYRMEFHMYKSLQKNMYGYYRGN